jgi:hypothetical protein
MQKGNASTVIHMDSLWLHVTDVRTRDRQKMICMERVEPAQDVVAYRDQAHNVYNVVALCT